MSTWPTREEIYEIALTLQLGSSLHDFADAVFARFEPWRQAQDVECATHGCQFTTVAQQRNEAHAALEAASEWAAALDAMNVGLMTGQERMVFNTLRAARADLALALPLARASLDRWDGIMSEEEYYKFMRGVPPADRARLRGA